MLKDNLKVGDKFTDGNKEFEITEIFDYGYAKYNAKFVRFTDEKITPPVVKREEPKEEITTNDVKKYTKTEINRTPNDELEKICKDLGLEIGTGTAMKKAIIEKLGL